jgi:DNA-binding response OmpR family regulator
MCERCAQLQAENDSLRAMLGTKVRADVFGRLRENLGVSPQQALFLTILFRTPEQVVSAQAIIDALPSRYTKSADGKRSEHYLRTMVHQTRQWVGPGVIRTERGRGYALTNHGAYVLREAMSGRCMIGMAA